MGLNQQKVKFLNFIIKTKQELSDDLLKEQKQSLR